MSSMAGTGRIVSMDQFRGYTVAGMFVVNFLGGLAVTHPVLKHNNTFFSYADSIMPSFMFACGFSYRLSLLRRIDQVGWSAASGRVVKRSLGLILVSLVLYGFGESFGSWSEMTAQGARDFVARLFKANLWEVLAIIGAVQILLLPVVTASVAARVGAMFGLSALHLIFSYLFNYDFVYGQPNWLNQFWGVPTQRSWDGGFFGLLQWAVPMLAGTVAYDLVQAGPRGRAVRRLIGWGAVFMLAAYLLSGLNRLYTVEDRDPARGSEIAASPVLPPLDRLAGRSASELLADPPFVEPTFEARNYWMMDKRVVTGTFIWFSTGFAMVLYALFILACDPGGRQLELFRMLGQNPLAAYIIHHMVENTVHAIVPKDSPLGWTVAGLLLFFGITILFVRFLDRQKMYLRL